MLAYIYRIIRDFEQEHGIHPNLLYLNRLHSEHLKSAFSENYSMQRIAEVLQLELVIDQDSMHPHVLWTQSAQKKIAS
jgi:hypothetical protein